jgi:hypothetical protein
LKNELDRLSTFAVIIHIRTNDVFTLSTHWIHIFIQLINTLFDNRGFRIQTSTKKLQQIHDTLVIVLYSETNTLTPLMYLIFWKMNWTDYQLLLLLFT